MKRPYSNCSGFSLLELLVVIVIMISIASIAAISMVGVQSTYERKKAVSAVMGIVEQARVTAIRSGSSVSVILALSRDDGASSDAMMIIGEPMIGSSDTSKVPYTRWIRLPKTIRFRSSADTLATSQLPGGIDRSMLPPIGGDPVYAGFTFNSTGQIEYPGGSGLILALYEGLRTSGGAEKSTGATAKATQNLSDNGLYDVIRLSRYTGRVRTEVSTLGTK